MSLLASEIAQIPSLVDHSLSGAEGAIQEVVFMWRAVKPASLFTVARGTSDAAATFAANRLARATGVPVGSFTPSLATVYGLDFQQNKGLMALGISQSGASPDLVSALSAFPPERRLALTNTDGSVLEEAASIRVPIGAGIEKSVAATKSFVCTLLVLDRIATQLSNGKPPATSLLIDATAKGLAHPAELSALETCEHCLVLGRGVTLAVAQEAALKLKETAGIHAEAISTAEVQHGPRALAASGTPVVIFTTADLNSDHVADVARWFESKKCPVIAIGGSGANDEFSGVLTALLSFYAALPGLAKARGHDPDRPPSLNKVTLTV